MIRSGSLARRSRSRLRRFLDLPLVALLFAVLLLDMSCSSRLGSAKSSVCPTIIAIALEAGVLLGGAYMVTRSLWGPSAFMRPGTSRKVLSV